MGMSHPPYDPVAEASLIAGMMGLTEIVGSVVRQVTAGDFYDGRARAAFETIADAWHVGDKVDNASLLAGMKARGVVDPAWLANAYAEGGAAWQVHADAVVSQRLLRDLDAAVQHAPAAVRLPGADPYRLLDDLRTRLAAIDVPVTEPPGDLWPLDDFVDEPEPEDGNWVVPGLLAKDWRVVVVAGEGVGKSMLWRQFSVLSAQGIHPLRFNPIPPVRTLLVDLENPSAAIKRSCRVLRDGFDRNLYERGRAFLWHRPGGVDLRSRAGRAELESVLASCRPDLVCLGPLYKAYQRKAVENDEQAAAEVQAVLDDLRIRYEFGLLLEHHAPHGASTANRDLRPYGSTLWLRWPEMGIAMKQINPHGERRHVELERWRGDRLSNEWPTELLEGQQWPWVAAS